MEACEFQSPTRQTQQLGRFPIALLAPMSLVVGSQLQPRGGCILFLGAVAVPAAHSAYLKTCTWTHILRSLLQMCVCVSDPCQVGILTACNTVRTDPVPRHHTFFCTDVPSSRGWGRADPGWGEGFSPTSPLRDNPICYLQARPCSRWLVAYGPAATETRLPQPNLPALFQRRSNMQMQC
jgi:hypothetical protein